MNEIKSVRVRKRDVKSGTLDIKVTLYEDRHTFGSDDRILVGINNDRPVWIQTTYKKSGIYKKFTDDQFIDEFILMNSKMDGGGIEYDIIQEPWELKVPIWRKYGFDPYYLNNGAQIFINWNEDTMVVGGYTYSSDRGEEINTTALINKTHWIVGVDETLLLHLTKNNEIDYRKIVDVKKYDGLVKDIYIIEDIITAWKNKVPNYDQLALCSPNNESCSFIPYKNPLKPIELDSPTPVAVNAESGNKEKIKIVLHDQVVKVKEDVVSLMVHIGVINEKLPDEKISEQDEFIDGEGVDYSEYVENEFLGEDEKWEPIPGIDDTFDPDTDKGGDTTTTPQSFVPATQTQKDFIKTAIKATLSRGEKHGKCARFTFNHVNNYVRLMQGKPVETGDVHNAGGNARDSGYHKNLQNMGYKITTNETISKSNLIDKITNGAWAVGDVIIYWCTDGASNSSHVMYGHTQIFTNGYHNNSNYRWSTDNMNNYNSSFVYRRKSGETYKFIHLQAPKTKRLQDLV